MSPFCKIYKTDLDIIFMFVIKHNSTQQILYPSNPYSVTLVLKKKLKKYFLTYFLTFLFFLSIKYGNLICWKILEAYMSFLYRKISFVEFYKRRIVEILLRIAMPGILFYIYVDLFLLFYFCDIKICYIKLYYLVMI